MQKAIKVITIVIVVAATAAGGGYYYWVNTPKYALLQIKKGFESGNKALVETHVDIDKLVDNFVDDFVTGAVDGNSNTQSFGATIAAGLVHAMKPQIKSIAHREILKRLGEDSPEPNPGQKKLADAGIYKRVIDNLTSPDKETEFLGITSETQTRNIAYISLGFENKLFEQDFDIELKLEKSSGVWQLVHLSNAVKVAKAYTIWEKEYIKRLNKPIIRKMVQTVQLAGFKKTKRQDEWGISKEVVMNIMLKNKVSEDVSYLKGTLKVYDYKGNPLSATLVELPNGIAAGQEWYGSITKTINFFMTSQKELFRSESKDLRVSLDLEQLRFANGKTLQLLDSMPKENRMPASVSNP